MAAAGLRAQILAALSAAFIVAFTLLGIAMVQLTARARTLDQQRGADSLATAVAAAVDRLPSERASLWRYASALIESERVTRVEVAPGHGLEPLVYGGAVSPVVGSASLDRGGRVRVWLRPTGRGPAAPLTNLLLLYVALTGGGILVLTYVALTYLIVRPVTALTQASERVAGGRLSVTVPVRGAGEVARLARAFNVMAAQLRRDREALENRLRELEQTTADLKEAQDQVIRSERLASVGRLSAGIAHEIGNPLAAVSGLVELLRDGDVPEEEQQEFLERVHRETGRIHEIIRDLLDFARLDTEEPGSADVAAAIKDAVKLVEPQKAFRKVEIRQHIEAGLPRVRGSQEQLSQLVVNLLLNAADAMEGEGQVNIHLEATNEGAKLRVIDTGPGLPEDLRDVLFEPFVTTKPPGHGTGLGLAVCHTIAQRAGGRIRAMDAPEGGACFEVFLPSS